MDSLQLSELQSFFGSNKGELASSKKFYVDSVDRTPLDILDPVLERVLDLSEYIPSDIVDPRINIYTQISSDYSDQQSLSQVVVDATAVVHGERYPGEGSVLPPPVVNFLEPGQSPDPSDYSDDSSSTPQHMPEFSQLTSPGADAPSTSFQWPSCNVVKREHFSFKPSDTSNYGMKHDDFGHGLKQEDFGHSSCQISQPGVPDATSFPFVTSPTTSLPSPTSTVYSVSSPGTPGPSGPTRGRRPHGSTAPYSTKSRRRQVEKGTQEYVEKRARNNVAVRKSREKARQKQKETEVRVKSLQDQNDQLQKKVDLLTKELNVLKGLFMNIGSHIPDEILKMVENS